MQRVHTITESGTSESGGVVNLAHVYSTLNRKYIPQVDKSGNAQLFTVIVRAISNTANKVTLKTATNAYPTRQAVKAWHKAWRKQYRDAGVSIKTLGKYGQNLRVDLTEDDVALGSALEDGEGEWTRTSMVTTASTDPGDSGTITAPELVDDYYLHLCNSTVVQTHADTVRFTSAGMIESWIDSRKKPQGIDAEDVQPSQLMGTNNPLVHARGQSLHSERLADEIRTLQEESPPYSDGNASLVTVQGTIKSNADLIGERMVQVPCGLLKIAFEAACTLEIELLDISDM